MEESENPKSTAVYACPLAGNCPSYLVVFSLFWLFLVFYMISVCPVAFLSCIIYLGSSNEVSSVSLFGITSPFFLLSAFCNFPLCLSTFHHLQNLCDTLREISTTSGLSFRYWIRQNLCFFFPISLSLSLSVQWDVTFAILPSLFSFSFWAPPSWNSWPKVKGSLLNLQTINHSFLQLETNILVYDICR